MASVFEVADWFLANATSVDNKKLQKLCYYAYAWFIALNNDGNKITERLYDARFEAWVHGAVEPNLYAKYKGFGAGIIPATADNSEVFSPAELDVLQQVNEVYGAFSGNQLESICHQESPWQNARGSLRANEPSHAVISDKDIFNCYAARL